MYKKVMKTFKNKEMLADGAVVLVEHEGELQIDDSRFSFRRDYTYGMTKLIQLRK